MGASRAYLSLGIWVAKLNCFTKRKNLFSELGLGGGGLVWVGVKVFFLGRKGSYTFSSLGHEYKIDIMLNGTAGKINFAID